MERFVVQSAVRSHHRGPQHGVFSSSPFWFSVFTDSVSLAGTLAAAANKADIYKKIIICTSQCSDGTQCSASQGEQVGKKIKRISSGSHFFKTSEKDTLQALILQISKGKNDYTPLYPSASQLFDSDFLYEKITVFFISKATLQLQSFRPHGKEGAKRCGYASLSSLVSFTKCWKGADMGQARGQLPYEGWPMQTMRSRGKKGAGRGGQGS